jgi:hypothetical protein
VDISLAKAQVTQSGEHPGLGFDVARPFGKTVLAAVRVSEVRLRCGARDEELAAMGRAVMRSTNGDDVFELVLAALGAWLEVVQIEKRRMGTAWNPAALVVAPEHGAT